MSDIFTSQEFGIMLTFFFYMLGVFLYQKTKLPIFSPLLIATVMLIIYIKVFNIDLALFLTDLSGIHLFLGPLIVSLAIQIYKRMDLIRKNFLVIFIGSVVGAGISILTVVVLGPLLNINPEVVTSMIPKASTTPIAIEVSAELGGIKAITVAVVVITAVLGAEILPLLIKLFKIKDPRVIGLGLGSTSQAVGTAKAFSIDKEAGAIASVSLVFTGVLTALFILIL